MTTSIFPFIDLTEHRFVRKLQFDEFAHQPGTEHSKRGGRQCRYPFLHLRGGRQRGHRLGWGQWGHSPNQGRETQNPLLPPGSVAQAALQRI